MQRNQDNWRYIIFETKWESGRRRKRGGGDAKVSSDTRQR